MMTLREALAEAAQDNRAIAHFNITGIDMVHAVVRAARSVGDPVIIGVSESERDFFGVNQIVAVIESLRKETGHPIYLNADHTYSVDRVKEAIDAGFDAVIYDGAKLPLDENIMHMKECVSYARQSQGDILVEGEVGYIGGSSKILDAMPEGVTPESMTTPEQAKRFISETGVDLFSPSVGNVHGMLRNAPNPRLDIARVKEISEATGKPLVLHGGSGISDDDFRAAIEAGMRIVHISTELRRAYRTELDETLREMPDEVAPYRYLRPAVEAVEKVAGERMRLFRG
ncbi:MAG: class II fructose-bisphosphate aldolase [Candidatus Yonathbacteria bacterium]|nr:class II fructose-bisphosphate aldolase [Candidatus Yonathbacteria bacterium]